jgi:hypothetical protein
MDVNAAITFIHGTQTEIGEIKMILLPTIEFQTLKFVDLMVVIAKTDAFPVNTLSEIACLEILNELETLLKIKSSIEAIRIG